MVNLFFLVGKGKSFIPTSPNIPLSSLKHPPQSFVQPKFFPDPDSTNPHHEIKAKHAHKTLMDTVIAAKIGHLTMPELEKLQKEMEKGTAKKKKDIADAEKEKKKEEEEAEAKEKARIERLKEEEARKAGQSYVNDEDFFAGLE